LHFFKISLTHFLTNRAKKIFFSFKQINTFPTHLVDIEIAGCIVSECVVALTEPTAKTVCFSLISGRVV
jgi:hypothetical protein